MKRLTNLAAVGITLALVATATAQTHSSRTLADRFGALRDGWALTTDAEGTAPSEPAPAALPQPVAVPATPRPFPRVNPRELLPRKWFGVGVQSAAPVEPESPVIGPEPAAPAATDRAAGTARARLLRDMRRGPVATDEPRVASRPPARAGSVLSPNVKPAPVSGASVDANLARSIAEEAADAVAVESPTPLEPLSDEPFADADAEVEASQPLETEPETQPVAATDPTPPAPVTPAADDVTPAEPDATASGPVAAIPSPEQATTEGGIRVATNPKAATKLPLFIGDRYSNNQPEESPALAEAPAEDPFVSTPPDEPAPERVAAAPQRGARPAPSAEDGDLLLTQQMPVLVSKVAGPRTIIVGREADYRVLLANRGDVSAERVVSRVTVPEWAEVVSVEAVSGAVERESSTAGEETLVWRADRLGAGQIVRLDLRLIARTGRPIELGLTHTHQPIDASTLVEVQEPKLQLSMLGPEEVLFGQAQTFRLTISNPGTGAAEDVVLHLTPPGGGTQRSTSHDFGVLAAGEQRTVEIELTAREAGQLAVTASATADGGVTAETVKEVFCRKPELVVDWRGPADRYAGAPAVYYFRVRNPGTAVAPGVVLKAQLPEGFEVIPSEETPSVENGRLAFQVGPLRPGDDKYFELRGVLSRAGANEIVIQAKGSDETRSKAVHATTEVIALADLKLDVLDPQGPVAMGEEAAYEIRVTNRGSSDAHDVRVVGLFSEGIEPHHADGGVSDIHDGRVAFETIGRLAPGEVRQFTIHARAYEEGTHLFRAEVLCRDLEIKLAAEETTRFFEDDPIDVAGEGYPTGSTGSRYPR